MFSMKITKKEDFCIIIDNFLTKIDEYYVQMFLSDFICQGMFLQVSDSNIE